MRRVQLDLKDDDGREAFLSLATAADVVVESFRPGVVDRLGIGYDDVSARNPGIVYCSTSGYGQEGPHAQWAGHDLDYLAVGGFLAMSTPGPDGAPPLPGATIADAAAGGMQAALAITAALARARLLPLPLHLSSPPPSLPPPPPTSRAEAPTSMCRSPTACSGSCRSPSTSSLPSGSTSTPATTSSRVATPATPPTGRPTPSGWPSPPSRPSSSPTSVPPSVAPSWPPPSSTTRRSPPSAPRSRPPSPPAHATSGSSASPEPTHAWRRSSTSPRSSHIPSSPPAVPSSRRPTPRRASFRQLAPLLAGMDRGATPDLPDPTVTDTEHLLKEAGVDGGTVARWVAKGVVA